MNYEYISMNTIEENNKLLGEVERLRNEKQELLETIDKITNDASKYVKRIDKAIEYINNLSNEPNVFGHYGIDGNCKKWLLNILKGETER